MCGIVYSESFTGQPVNNNILQQYDAQKTRGQEGFGVFDGINGHLVHAAEERRILNWLCKEKNNSSLLLMHHRYPTSTINVRQAAHPFTTKNYFGATQYILVHNGTIQNADELFVAHQELGINYHSLLSDLTFNDSEALMWDFALFMEGKQKAVTASGAIAFICLKLVKGKLEKMYFARNSSPLNLLRTKEGISLSSEGEGESIDPYTLYTWNYARKRLTTRKLDLKSYVYTGAYGGYRPTEYRASAWEEDDDWGYPNYDNYGVINNKERAWDKFDRYLKKQHQSKTDENVKLMALEYLTACGGHFESAYWAVEADYELLQEEIDKATNSGGIISLDKYWEIRQLEGVLDFISNDPGFVNEGSISQEGW